KEQEALTIIISDNGVGRKNAAKRSKKPTNHTSRATEILWDRQKLLQEDPSIDLNIFMEDLHPERAHTGTKVTIKIA
ncbi:MAG: hypothetical protein AAGA31_20655, partial [Bacteroidota bacterium]